VPLCAVLGLCAPYCSPQHPERAAVAPASAGRSPPSSAAQQSALRIGALGAGSMHLIARIEQCRGNSQSRLCRPLQLQSMSAATMTLPVSITHRRTSKHEQPQAQHCSASAANGINKPIELSWRWVVLRMTHAKASALQGWRPPCPRHAPGPCAPPPAVVRCPARRSNTVAAVVSMAASAQATGLCQCGVGFRDEVPICAPERMANCTPHLSLAAC